MKIDHAVEAYQKTIYIDESCVLAHFNLARLYRLAGNQQDAVREYRNTVRKLQQFSEDEEIKFSGGFSVRLINEICHQKLKQLGRRYFPVGGSNMKAEETGGTLARRKTDLILKQATQDRIDSHQEVTTEDVRMLVRFFLGEEQYAIDAEHIKNRRFLKRNGGYIRFPVFQTIY